MIALVVTIIILIILATISIIVVFGENGLIAKAERSKEFHELEQEREQNDLKYYEDFAGNYLNNMNKDNLNNDDTPKGPNGKTLVTSVTEIQEKTIQTEDINGNPITIPKGFKVRKDLGNTIQDGIVIEDVEKNQFVWIPVSNINHDGTDKITLDNGSKKEITLGRYDFSGATGIEKKLQYGSEYDLTGVGTLPAEYGTGNGNIIYELKDSREATESNTQSGENATAKNLKEFIESVEQNHGYYLARYEAGISATDSTKPTSIEGEAWRGITQGKAAIACRNMYEGNTKVEIESDLVNSYAWDTAIVYIQEMGHSNYANQPKGSIDAAGDIKCNIYNMVGNCFEWTTEYSLYTDEGRNYPCIGRGGTVNNIYTNCPAARNYYLSTYKSSDYSFRVLLYI